MIIYRSEMKRIFDFTVALFSFIALIIPMGVVALLVRLGSNGPILYWSERVGKNNKAFRMPKFRTMRIDTPTVATHLLDNPAQFLTPGGSFLRRSSLDELPQLWSILCGDMSFVGPRPALYNQQDLISLRTKYGVHTMLPGLTGWAQINGRDDLSIAEKVSLDLEYAKRQSVVWDLKIVFLTFLRVINAHGISH